MICTKHVISVWHYVKASTMTAVPIPAQSHILHLKQCLMNINYSVYHYMFCESQRAKSSCILVEGLGFGSQHPMAASKHVLTHFQGIRHVLLAFVDTSTHLVNNQTCRQTLA